jgi:hypothetical protein
VFAFPFWALKGVGIENIPQLLSPAPRRFRNRWGDSPSVRSNIASGLGGCRYEVTYVSVLRLYGMLQEVLLYFRCVFGVQGCWDQI